MKEHMINLSPQLFCLHKIKLGAPLSSHQVNHGQESRYHLTCNPIKDWHLSWNPTKPKLLQGHARPKQKLVLSYSPDAKMTSNAIPFSSTTKAPRQELTEKLSS